ncbi:hypothetical protein PG996_005477 [Apiospora saccharicola]|uniref:Uncharacterized protein n=1 Tax=Apiospora saccharicola TaxID=335842 RepID=A0ABR1VLJ8_9PEZI
MPTQPTPSRDAPGGFQWSGYRTLRNVLYEQIDARNIETPSSKQIAAAADHCRFLVLPSCADEVEIAQPEEPIGSKVTKSPRVQEKS